MQATQQGREEGLPYPTLTLLPLYKTQIARAAGNKRKLRVAAQPNVTMAAAHVPPHCRRARTVLLGPLVPGDVDAASFVALQQGARRRASDPAWLPCALRVHARCSRVL